MRVEGAVGGVRVEGAGELVRKSGWSGCDVKGESRVRESEGAGVEC